MNDFIKNEFMSHINIANLTLDSLCSDINTACNDMIAALKNGNKIMLCGNGGSAADCQHFAAELSGRYRVNRAPLSAVALTTDTSALTAIGNDFGFEFIFSRQVEAIAKNGDILIAISTSGNSINIINAALSAKNCGCNVIGLCGNDGGKLRLNCDVNIVVPSNDTPRIQEMHLLIEHIICDVIEREFS